MPGDLLNELGYTKAERAARYRAELLRLIAPTKRCALCGTRPRKRPLEIDHIDGRDYDPSKLDRATRARRYLCEYRRGVRLRALCRSCNARDGGRRRWTA